MQVIRGKVNCAWAESVAQSQSCWGLEWGQRTEGVVGVHTGGTFLGKLYFYELKKKNTIILTLFCS